MRQVCIGLIILLFPSFLLAQDIEQIIEKDRERIEVRRKQVFQKRERHHNNSQPKIFKAKVGNKKVAFVLNLRKLEIVAHSGSEVVIEATGVKPPNERAKGLVPVYNSQVDNTGVGLNMEDKDGEVRFKQAAGQNRVRYKIKVPQKNNLSVEMGWSTSELVIDGSQGEIEVNLTGGDLKLKNIQGPVVAHLVSGDVEAQFNALSQKGPTSLQVVSGFVDITLPKTAKTDISLKATTGQIYMADSKIIVKKKEAEKDKHELFFTGMPQHVTAQMNGGGVKLSLESVSGDIYLRNK